MSNELRLTPEMVSRKLLTLRFIQDYIGKWSGSPSLGEIAAATATSRQSALRTVQTLNREGYIIRRPGPRGITLPDPHAIAVERLRAEGWLVLHGRDAVTESALPLIPELDHVPAGEQGPHDRQA